MAASRKSPAESDSTSTLHRTVVNSLKLSNCDFVENAAIGGVQADFVARGPRGASVVFELKSWEPTKANVDRASHYAKQLSIATGVPQSFVVLPEIKKELPQQGVVSPKGLANIFALGGAGGTTGAVGGAGGILVYGAGAPGSRIDVSQPLSGASGVPRGGGRGRAPKDPASKALIFAAMPFAAHYDDVFFVAIAGAAKSLKAVARRVDHEDFEGDIVAKIKSRIAQAKAVVVDLSDNRPNVLYEMGFAQASTKAVVPICSTPSTDLPFDVRNLNVLFYEKGRTQQLLPKLKRRLKAALDGSEG